LGVEIKFRACYRGLEFRTLHPSASRYTDYTVPVPQTLPWRRDSVTIRTDVFVCSPIPVATRSKALVCAARLLALGVRTPPEACMSVSCKCCLLRWAGLCVGLITLPEESYRVWCVLSDREDSITSRPWPINLLGVVASWGGGEICLFTIWKHTDRWNNKNNNSNNIVYIYYLSTNLKFKTTRFWQFAAHMFV
jgi:hypothetical protein